MVGRYLNLCLGNVDERHEVRNIQRVMHLISGLIHHRGSKTRSFLYNGFTPYIKSRDDNMVTPQQICKVLGEVFGKNVFLFAVC